MRSLTDFFCKITSEHQQAPKHQKNHSTVQYCIRHFPSLASRFLGFLFFIGTVNGLCAQEYFEAEIDSVNQLSWETRRDYFQEALSTGKGTPLQQARYHHELGVVHFVLDDLFQAIEQTEQALSLRLEYEVEAGESVCHSAYNLGSFYHNLENFDEAFAHFQLVVDRAPNSRLGYTLFRLGSLYRDLGEFQLSEQAFQDALKESPFPDDQAERATLLVEWADLYLKQNSNVAGQSALALLEQAYQSYHELAASDDYYASLAVLSLNRFGLAYNQLEDYQQALSYFQKALQYNRECCEDEDLSASIYTNMGITYRRLEQAETAISWHRKALDIRLPSSTSGKTDMGLAKTYDNLATTYLDLGNARTGLEYIQQALAWALPRFTPAEMNDDPPLSLLRSSPNKNSILIYLQDKAALWNALAEEEQDDALLNRALATYRSGDQLIDLMRADHLEKNTKLYWREQAQQMYQSAVRAAWKAGRPDEAFYFSEKSRAVLLLDGLQELNAHSRLPSATQKQLARLAAEIQYLEKRVYQEGAVEEAAPNEKLSLLQEQYRHLLDSIEASFPEYYRQKYQLGIIRLEELQQQLVQGETWLEYFLADDFTLAFLIRRDEIRMIELAAPAVLEPQIEALLEQLKNYRSAFDPRTAQELYQALIAPLQLPAAVPLTIVPDARLSLIPFEVLLENTPTDQDYGNWDFLLKKHAIKYAFSASSRYFIHEKPRSGNGKVLAFAPMAMLAPEVGVDESLELPQTRFTVEYISRILPTDVYLGREAHRAQLALLAPEASVLHFATHAYLDHERPEFSYFLVADPDPEQRRFYVNELYQFQFKAELAVLSACETGAGKLFRGEGIASIGRAFAQNGCPNLTMSLWPVDEGSTSRLLERYYENLEMGMAKGTALHQAKLDYLQQTGDPKLKHPFRWSGFVYYGQDTPLALQATSWFRWPYWLGATLVIAGIFLFVFRKKR